MAVHLSAAGDTVYVVPDPQPGFRGALRSIGKLQGRTQDIKKAYVRLAPGQTIDYEAKIKA